MNGSIMNRDKNEEEIWRSPELQERRRWPRKCNYKGVEVLMRVVVKSKDERERDSAIYRLSCLCVLSAVKMTTESEDKRIPIDGGGDASGCLGLLN